MADLTTKSVREILNGQIMTAGDIAKAGGWDFGDVCAFFCKHVVCEVETQGFERHMIAGRGVGYKWIGYSKAERVGQKREYKLCAYTTKQRQDIVLEHLSKVGESVLKIDLAGYGWGGNIQKTIRDMIKNDLIEFCRRGQKNFAAYRLTEKGRQIVAKNDCLEVV